MKVAIVVLVLAVASVSVYAETCSSVHDCLVTGCNHGGSLVCDIDGKCTCDSGHNCTDGENVGIFCRSNQRCRDWYDSSTHHRCECADTHNLHCIDSQCKCGYPPN
ncbi:uncharacterized protein LOC121389950 [Gigantopelta aegis]|uniref:uncharacterized protein LOC121389950 n=1 Tax=Gigantopelta aegis TaxID=1735272 RepID=UPI001B88ABD7|nr:uncharacterized protein LOC121389950 [Gigantopelta aegis]